MELINKEKVLKIIDEAGDLGEAHGDINHNCNIILTIPDNPTNGDMIKAIFPKSRIYKLENFVQFWYTENEDGRHVNFRRDWWDAPYKSESEE